MSDSVAQDGFDVYFDPSKSTSGQRFFAALRDELIRGRPVSGHKPKAILFNVSAPIGAIIKARLRGQRVLLRIDGLYFDRLSPRFLATFSWPVRTLLAIGLRHAALHDFLAHIGNLLNENYAAFLRILLADHLIYQSRHCYHLHRRYFPNKPYSIIVNGATYRGAGATGGRRPADAMIRLITIYDGVNPRKRIHDVVEFVRWAHEIRNVPVQLVILGYTGRIPDTVPSHIRSLIETSPYIHTYPRFSSFDADIRNALYSSDAYITFSFRDPCPNAVIESMAHGLPVVGMASGGLPDIVADAGILLPAGDDADSFFYSWRFESEFPRIDNELVLTAVMQVKKQSDMFRARVRDRFATELGIEHVARRYAAALRAAIT